MWCSEACRVRVARLGSASGLYSGALMRDPCVYCGDEARELDHITPRSGGGAGDWLNLAPVCRRCNAQKKTLDVLRFMLARPLFSELERVRADLAELRAVA